MKKLLTAAVVIAVSLPLMSLLQGCMKDSCRNTYTIYSPIYKSLTQVRAEMKSQPAQPLENTGKLYVYGNYIFLNELNKGIHVIDNSNPASPKNMSFISVPGNVDIAVKGNYLYADCYSDIVVFDISNPANVVAKTFMDNVIPEMGYYWQNHTSPDSVQILVGYHQRDTTVDCDTWNYWNSCSSCIQMTAGGVVFFASASLANSGPPAGKGGSMARFSIVNNFLYGVSREKIYAFDIANGLNPQLTNSSNVGFGIETIYPFRDKLFIGSTTGMFIYDITNPSDPVQQGMFSHARSCDPVIADDELAYVTLRSGNACTGFTNQMDVLDIRDLSNPSLLKTYQMSNPHGLGKDGNILFLCDGAAGLKVYSVADPLNIQLIKEFKEPDTYDVIMLNGIAIVVAKDGLYQFDYSDPDNIRQISRLSISGH